MTDQTPRVPDLWWSPKNEYLYGPRLVKTIWCGPPATPPADAVKLGDIEALRTNMIEEVREVEEERNEQELRALAAEAARRELAKALRLDEELPMDYLIEQARGVWDHAAEFFAGRAEERSRAQKAEARLDEIEAWLGAEESATHKLAGIRAIVEGVQR